MGRDSTTARRVFAPTRRIDAKGLTVDNFSRSGAHESRTSTSARLSTEATQREVLADQLLRQLGTSILAARHQCDHTLGLEIESVVIRPSRSDVQLWFRTGRTLRIIASNPGPSPLLAITDDGEIVSCRDAIGDLHEPLLCLGRTSQWQNTIRDLVQHAGCGVAITRVTPVRVHLYEPSDRVPAGETNMFRLDATGRLTIDQRPAVEWLAAILAR